jgi:membrane associated rhomboid family serine protease
MVVVPVPLPTMSVNVDVCTICQFFWFDADELHALPPAPPPPPPPKTEEPLPPAAREAVLKLKTHEILRRARERRLERFETEGSDDLWQTVLGFFGLPVEIDHAVHQRPWATWGLATVTVLVSLLAFEDLNQAVTRYGLIPSQAGRLGGLTWVTSFFLHGGLLHLLGNVYFLLVFGDNVEEFLGPGPFLLLIAASAFVGDVLHVAFDPHSNMPLIGASGGISGVIVFYALQFPNARLGFLFGAFYYFRWISVSAYGALTVWVALQAIGALQQIEGFSNVSSLAHLAGAAAGVAFWVAMRGRSPAFETRFTASGYPPK